MAKTIFEKEINENLFRSSYTGQQFHLLTLKKSFRKILIIVSEVAF